MEKLTRRVGVVDASELGQAIATSRRRQGLTQQDLADLVGVQRPYVSRLEQGNTTKYLERLTEMLDVLGLELVVRHRRERTAFDLDDG